MRLGIISDCIHYRDKTGRIGSTNHVYVKQMNTLATHFKTSVFCTPVLDVTPDTPLLSYYTQPGIEFSPLPQAGGKKFMDKIRLISMIPRWFYAFYLLSKRVDIIYQRFPNNLNIPGFFFILFSRIPAFATYTGTWLGYKGESVTYKFQRWLLKYIYPGPVFVYDFNIKHPRIFPSTSPSYSLEDWNGEIDFIQEKLNKINSRNATNRLELLSVGSLTPYKNHILLLEACVILKSMGLSFSLNIAGQGRLQPDLQYFIEKEGLTDSINLLGVIPQEELRKYYRRADFVIQPSIIEGYGKVPIEAMFHGAIPLLSAVSIHPFFIGTKNERGAIFDLNSPMGIVNSIKLFTNNKEVQCNAILAGRAFSKDFTLEAWTQGIISVLTKKGIYA